MTTKVKNTVSHKTSQGDVLVTKGKLVIINNNEVPTKVGDFCYHGNNGYLIITEEIFNDRKHWEFAKKFYSKVTPIIISEIEEIKLIDNYLFVKDNTIHNADVGDENVIILNNLQKIKKVFKILALPEHFSSKHLQSIIDGKLKENDEVYVECEYNKLYPMVQNYNIQIKLNKESNVTLHKINKNPNAEAIDIIETLMAYGNINLVEGVVYPQGSHSDYIKKAQNWLNENRQHAKIN